MFLIEYQHLSSLALVDNQETIVADTLLRNYLELLAHDFVTPLSIINVNLYLMERSQQSEEFGQLIGRLKTQSQHLQVLFDELMAMLRLDLHKHESNYLRCNILEILENLHGTMRFYAKQKGVHLVFCPSEASIPTLWLDSSAIERAIRNIIENALNHCPQNASVLLHCILSETELIIQVQDNGTGIAPEDLPFIFNRFYRGDKNRNASTGNLGLGLPISREIIHAHGGHIEVDTAYGYGTNVRIHLPIQTY